MTRFERSLAALVGGTPLSVSLRGPIRARPIAAVANSVTRSHASRWSTSRHGTVAAVCAAALSACRPEPEPAHLEPPSGRPAVEAGYIDLEALEYSYSATDLPAQSLDYTASPTRMFYSFTAAMESDSGRTFGQAFDPPLLVIFNGGPGSATTGNLLAFGTAAYTLSDGDADNGVRENPFAWTRVGDLLYIDARQSGFSYSTLPDPTDEAARAEEASVKNFNLYVDAADFLRTLLGFLANHPELRQRRIVFVAESYGGLRTTLMLNYLFDSRRLVERGEWYYTDPALVREIHEHFRAVFPLEDPSTIAASTIARQFGHQILIQPMIVANHQFRYPELCSKEYGLGVRAEELGVPCPAQKGVNDVHHLAKPAGWLERLAEQARGALSSAEGFRQLMGIEPTAIPGLSPIERQGAFRGTDLSEAPGDLASLEASLGRLASHDHYFLGRTQYGEGLADSDYGGQDVASIKFGRFFLRNLVHVKTFVTRALLDSVINADRLPAALAEYIAQDDAPISKVELEVSERDGYERPGWIRLTYTGRQFDVEAGASRVIRFPTYRDAGHAVSASNPEELFLDVREFLHTDRTSP